MKIWCIILWTYTFNFCLFLINSPTCWEAGLQWDHALWAWVSCDDCAWLQLAIINDSWPNWNGFKLVGWEYHVEIYYWIMSQNCFHISMQDVFWNIIFNLSLCEIHILSWELCSLDLRCRHTSGRSYLTPWGNAGYAFVRMGNVLSTRSALLCLLASACKLRWVLEQPRSSFLPELPRFQWLWGLLQAWSNQQTHHRRNYQITSFFTLCEIWICSIYWIFSKRGAIARASSKGDVMRPWACIFMYIHICVSTLRYISVYSLSLPGVLLHDVHGYLWIDQPEAPQTFQQRWDFVTKVLWSCGIHVTIWPTCVHNGSNNT